jgi:hypothetical protein
VQTSVTHDWHGWDTKVRSIFSPPTYYSDSETLLRHVLPYIGKTDIPSGGGGGGSWLVLPDNIQRQIIANSPPISITQQDLQVSAPQLNIHIGDGLLSPGQSKKFELNVPQSENMNLVLITNNKELEMELTQPDGKIIPDDMQEIEYQELTLEKRTIRGYQFKNMLAGTWVVNINGTAILEDSFFTVSATPSTLITLQPILPEWRPNQNIVEISVKISSQDMPVLESELIAHIVRPDGSQQTLELFDDGSHQDGNANDGVYGNAFNQSDIGGVYRVFFTAKGMHNDQVFIRNAFSFFVIAPITAKFGDHFSDNGIDENRDGTYEFLEIQIPLLVNQSGDFVISGDLYAGDTYITSDGAHLSYQVGTQTAIMRFDGKMIYASQADGPYSVRNILLLDETDAPLLIEEGQVYTTAQYAYKDFGPKTEIFSSATLPQNFFVVGGLSILCFAIFIVGTIFVLYRTRHSGPSTSRQISQQHTIKPASASL